MNSKSSVLGLIIIYNPDPELLLDCINSVIEFVDELVIWSNDGDFPEFLDNMQLTKFTEQKNLGISPVFNKVSSYAFSKKYDYMLYLDQDSSLIDGSFDNLFKIIISTDNVVVGSRVVHSKNRQIETYSHKNLNLFISSGSIFDVEKMRYCNGYDERFFLDYADFEYLIRIRNQNYSTIVSDNSFILHNLGDRKVVNLFYYEFQISDRSPIRLYYISKNLVLLSKLHFGKNKILISILIFRAFFYYFKLCLISSNRFKKASSIFKGTLHGFMSK
jgi:rhamnosyltransferase